MRLSLDHRGLRYEIELDNTECGRNVAAMVGRGDVTGSSFSFAVKKQAFVTMEDMDVRELHEVELYDCGPVTFPAYTATSCSLGRLGRSLQRPAASRADVLRRARVVESEMQRLGARRYFSSTPAAARARAREVLRQARRN
jgi:phage head maturation protease